MLPRVVLLLCVLLAGAVPPFSLDLHDFDILKIMVQLFCGFVEAEGPLVGP